MSAHQERVDVGGGGHVDRTSPTLLDYSRPHDGTVTLLGRLEVFSERKGTQGYKRRWK